MCALTAIIRHHAGDKPNSAIMRTLEVPACAPRRRWRRPGWLQLLTSRDFGALLSAVAEVPDVKRLRFMTSHPAEVNDSMITAMRDHPNISRYLHLPVQSGSSRVLRRMKRLYTREQYLEIIGRLRAAIPEMHFSTDFIVGFPGETEDDFQQLCDFVTTAQFDWLGVFSYSDEEGSPAFLLTDKVPPKDIERRRRKLMQLQNRISRHRRKQWIGREIEVMLEGPSEETDLLWEARTPAHAPEIDGKVFINDFGDHESPQAGSFHRAIVEEAHDYDLVARLL